MEPTIRDTSARYQSLVSEIARECFATLSMEEILYFRRHPCPLEHHTALGSRIRSRYTSRFQEEGIPYQHDYVSMDVLNSMIPMVLPEYAVVPHCYLLFRFRIFCDLHAYYMLGLHAGHIECIRRNYHLLEQAYAMLPEREFGPCSQRWAEPAEEVQPLIIDFLVAIAKDLWNFPLVRKRATGYYGIDAAIVDGYEHHCLELLQNGSWGRGRILPSGLVYFHSQTPPEPPDTDAALTPIIWLLQNNPGNDRVLYDHLFSSRHFALVIARYAGRFLQRMPLFQDDGEIVAAAVSQDPDSILYASPRLQNDPEIVELAARNARTTMIFQNPIMKKHSDDDWLVGIACMANGANLAYASARLRDDDAIGMIAVRSIGEMFPYAAYQSLSKRLKSRKDLALIVIRSGHADIEDFPAALRDDDDIARALAEDPVNTWQLERMSPRIRKEYSLA